jgi:lysozyme family protein
VTGVDQLIEQLIDREGGYVNDPDDAGGETNWGITAAIARQHGYTGAMRDLPRAEAAAIYRRLYWLKPGFDRVAVVYPRVAAELFDTGVNMGQGAATVFLQRVLNALGFGPLVKDGQIGDATIAALGRFANKRGSDGDIALVHALDALQGERYVAICENNPTQTKYLYGWIAKRLGNA